MIHGPVHDLTRSSRDTFGLSTLDATLCNIGAFNNMPLVHIAFKMQHCSLFLDTSSTSSLLDLFRDIEVELHSGHSLHVSCYDCDIAETNVLAYNSKFPYSYLLTRTWECNCTASHHKRKTVHGIQLNSPLLHGRPDCRVYCSLLQLGERGSQGEPPHARLYRKGTTSAVLQDGYVEGSVSGFIDLTNVLHASQNVGPHSHHPSPGDMIA